MRDCVSAYPRWRVFTIACYRHFPSASFTLASPWFRIKISIQKTVGRSHIGKLISGSTFSTGSTKSIETSSSRNPRLETRDVTNERISGTYKATKLPWYSRSLFPNPANWPRWNFRECSLSEWLICRGRRGCPGIGWEVIRQMVYSPVILSVRVKYVWLRHRLISVKSPRERR